MKTFTGFVAVAFAIPAFVLTTVPASAASASASVRADKSLSAQVLARAKAPSITEKKRHLKPAMPRLEAGSERAEAILNRR